LVIAVYGSDLTFDVPYTATSPDGALTKALKKYGTQVSFVQVANATDLTAALAGGSAQLAVLPGTSVIAAAANGLALAPLANMYTGPGTVFVGAEKYKTSRGTNLAAYNGSRWAYVRPKNEAQLLAAAKVNSIGLKWSDQGQVQLGTGTNSQTALSSGRADMLVVGGASGAAAIDEGVGYAVYNAETDPASPYASTFTSVLTANQSFTKQYPQFTQDVVTAIVSTLTNVYKKSGVSADSVFSGLPSDVQSSEKPIFDTEWQLYASGFQRCTGGFSATGITQTTNLASSGGLLAKTPNFDTKTLFDNKWIVEAYKQLNIPVPQGIS
jgi:hypothetical protein